MGVSQVYAVLKFSKCESIVTLKLKFCTKYRIQVLTPYTSNIECKIMEQIYGFNNYRIEAQNGKIFKDGAEQYKNKIEEWKIVHKKEGGKFIDFDKMRMRYVEKNKNLCFSKITAHYKKGVHCQGIWRTFTPNAC